MKIWVLLLFPLNLFAADLPGSWQGPGICFLDQFATNACAVKADIRVLEDQSLLIEHCSQDTGSPVEVCFVNHFTVRHDHELWLKSEILGGDVKVGSVSESKIEFAVVYPNQVTKEVYEIVPEGLRYAVDYSQDGKSLLHEDGVLKKAP